MDKLESSSQEAERLKGGNARLEVQHGFDQQVGLLAVEHERFSRNATWFDMCGDVAGMGHESNQGQIEEKPERGST